MAHEPYTRTNQKIYFAGLSLEALGRAEEGKEMNAIALLLAGRFDLGDHFSALTMLLNSRPRTSKFG